MENMEKLLKSIDERLENIQKNGVKVYVVNSNNLMVNVDSLRELGIDWV